MLLNSKLAKYIIKDINPLKTGIGEDIPVIATINNPSGLKELRGCVSVLEIFFVGQCEVFVCLDFVETFSPWPRRP